MKLKAGASIGGKATASGSTSTPGASKASRFKPVTKQKASVVRFKPVTKRFKAGTFAAFWDWGSGRPPLS